MSITPSKRALASHRNHVAFGAQQSTVYAALPTLRWGVANRDGFSAQKEFNASVEGHKNPKEVMGKLLRASDEVKRGGEKIRNLGSFFSEMRASSRRGGDVLGDKGNK